MADSDQSLQIFIETIYRDTGVKLAEEDAIALKGKLGDFNDDLSQSMPENAKLWQKYKSILEETGGEALNLREKHHVLHAAIHALGPEFEGLGRYAMMVFHPLTATVAGVAGAFELWRYQTKLQNDALAAMQLPDLSEPIAQVNQLAQAQAEYAKALNETVSAYGSIEAASDRAIKKIKEQAELQKQLFGPSAGASQAEREAELAEMERKRSELTMSAAVKRRQANSITIASSETDSANLEDMKKQAEAAKKNADEARKVLEQLDSARSGNPGALLKQWFTFGGMKGSDIEKIQRDTIDQAATLARQAKEAEAEKAARDAQRAAKSKLLENAGKEEGEAENLRLQIADQKQSFGGKQLVEYLKQFNQTGDIQDLMGAMGMTLQAQHRLLAEIKAGHISQAAVTDEILAWLREHGIKIEQQQRQAESRGK